VAGYLGSVRSGDEISRADQVQEALLIYPAAAVYRLTVHERDIYRRAAETESAELEKEQSYLFQSFR
jgi:hypothetical protein